MKLCGMMTYLYGIFSDAMYTMVGNFLLKPPIKYHVSCDVTMCQPIMSSNWSDVTPPSVMQYDKVG